MTANIARNLSEGAVRHDSDTGSRRRGAGAGSSGRPGLAVGASPSGRGLVVRAVVCGFLFLLAAGGCSSNQAARAAPSPPSAPPPAPEPPPPPELQPPPPPRPPTPPPDGICIPVHTGECMPGRDFFAAAGDLAGEIRQDPNFLNQPGFVSIGVDRAHGHVSLLEGPDAAPGAGVTVGLIDTGIDEEHPVFREKTVTEVFLGDAVDEAGDDLSHGTAVASVAAGGRIADPDAAPGVAWGADVAMFALRPGPEELADTPVPLEVLAERDGWLAGVFHEVLSWREGDRRVDILNLSFSYHGLISQYTEDDLRANLPRTLATLAQGDAAEKAILVWAAGNLNGFPCQPGAAGCPNGRLEADSVTLLPGLMARIGELQGHSVAVVGLGLDGGRIADWSNRCGLAADFCIAAPGEGIRVALFGPEDGVAGMRRFGDEGGTSLAAPMVSGGLAVMKQLFRDQLSNEELVSRLFLTADNTGIYADREIYGHGRMDLGAATSPVGVLDVPIATGLATAAHASLGSTELRLGAAFGDGFPEALGDNELMALDDYGAPFWYGLGDFAATTDGPSMAARLRAFLGPAAGSGWWAGAGGRPGPGKSVTGMAPGVLRMPTAAGNGHLALAEGAVMVGARDREGLSAAAFTTGPPRALMPASGAVLSWRPEGIPVGFVAGWIEERGTMLGSFGQGAFGSLSAGTAFFGFEGTVDLAGWSLGADAELGVARPAAHGGIIREISPLATSTFAVHANRTFARRGSLALSLSQPLRVERGWASFATPAIRTRRGEVLYRSFRAELTPGERQLDLAGQWSRPLPLGELRLGAVWSHRPGHRSVLGPQLALLSGWRWTF